MASKDIAQALLEAYADGSKDPDLRSFIGKPGYRIDVRNETVDTGQGYLAPGFIAGLLSTIGALWDRHARDEFTVSNPLGQTSFTLTQTPRAAQLFQACKNGLALKSTDYSMSGKVVTTSGVLGDWFLFTYWY